MFEATGILLILLDIACLILVGLPFFILTLQHNPFKRGFFCDDESIRYPLREDTISYQLLGGVMIPFTLIVIICGECLSVYMSRVNHQSLGTYYVSCIYKVVGSFLFGAAASQSLTDIAKYSIGRLRPNFLAVCKPVWDHINCKTGDYIENFTCTGDKFLVEESRPLGNKYMAAKFIGQNIVRTSPAFTSSTEVLVSGVAAFTGIHEVGFPRVSFYSGHSSFSMYCMVFLVLYIHARMKSQWMRLLRPTIQFFLILTALYVGLSRVSDYKHHWSDVFTGLLQGAVVAILTVFLVTNFFEQPVGAVVSQDEASHTSLQESPSNGNHYGSTD